MTFKWCSNISSTYKKWIHPKTTIISDCWRAYDCLGNEGYQHLTVNHSLNFVDPKNPQIHTNRIESTWRHVKESFSTHGRIKAHVPGNLARYMFLKAARATNEDPTEKFLNMAAFIYKDESGESNEPGTSEGTMHV